MWKLEAVIWEGTNLDIYQLHLKYRRSPVYSIKIRYLLESRSGTSHLDMSYEIT